MANTVNESLIPGHKITSMTAQEQYDTASRRLKPLEQQKLSLQGRIDQMDPREYARQMTNLDVQIKQLEALRDLSATERYNQRESAYQSGQNVGALVASPQTTDTQQRLVLGSRKEHDDMSNQISREMIESMIREENARNGTLYKTKAQKNIERQRGQPYAMAAPISARSNATSTQQTNTGNAGLTLGDDITSITAQEQYDMVSHKLEELRQQKRSLIERGDQMNSNTYIKQRAELEVQIEELKKLQGALVKDLYYDREDTYLDTVKNSAVGSAYQSGQDAAQDQQVVLRLVAPNAANQPLYQADASEIAMKYGVNPESKTYQQDLMDLYQQLEQAIEQSNQEVEAAGFDPERVRKYEQRLAKEEEAELARANTEDIAQEHPMLSSAIVAGVSPLQGLDYITQVARAIGHSDITDPDTYIPLSTADMTATNFAHDVYDAVSGRREDDTTQTFWNRYLREPAYSTGMFAAQTLVSNPLPNTVANLLTEMSAAADGTRERIEMGASNKDALTYGLLDGLLGLLVVEIDLDDLVKQSRKGHAAKKLKQIASDAFQQVGIEATDAGVTEVADILSQAAILGDLSDNSTAVRTYMAQGMSKQEAKKQVFLDSVKQVGWAALENNINIGETGKRLRQHGAGVSE